MVARISFLASSFRLVCKHAISCVSWFNVCKAQVTVSGDSLSESSACCCSGLSAMAVEGMVGWSLVVDCIVVAPADELRK